jgi:hypothetical protein
MKCMRANEEVEVVVVAWQNLKPAGEWDAWGM